MSTTVQQSVSHYPNNTTLSSLATTMHHTSISHQQNNNRQVHMSISQILCSQISETSDKFKQVEDRRNKGFYYFNNNNNNNNNSNVLSQRSMTLGRVCEKCYTNKSPEWRKVNIYYSVSFNANIYSITIQFNLFFSS